MNARKHLGKIVAAGITVAAAAAIALAGGPGAVAATVIDYTQFNASTRAKVDNTRAFAVNADANQDIKKLSGPIAANGTTLKGIDLTGFSGTFIATISGQVDRHTVAGNPGLQVQPQLSLWRDCDNDGVFEWQDGEGGMSPNATIPDAKNRSVTINGTQVYSVYKACHTKLIAHAYSADGSPYKGDPEMVVGWATLTLVPIR